MAKRKGPLINTGMLGKRPNLQAAESAIRARLRYDPNGSASRYRKRWRLAAFRNRIARATSGNLGGVVLDILYYAENGDKDARDVLAEAIQQLGDERGILKSQVWDRISKIKLRRGISPFANVWSDETIALAVRDAIVFGGLTPYRNRASDSTSACSLVLKILKEPPRKFYMNVEAVEKIWERLGPQLPTDQDQISGWSKPL